MMETGDRIKADSGTSEATSSSIRKSQAFKLNNRDQVCFALQSTLGFIFLKIRSLQMWSFSSLSHELILPTITRQFAKFSRFSFPFENGRF